MGCRGKKTANGFLVFKAATCLSADHKLTVLIRAVVSRDMPRSRDTIFRSLGIEGLKPRSNLGLGTSKSRKIGKSRPYFQSERKNPQKFEVFD